MTGEGIATPMLSISQYIGFLFTFVLSFGIVFEIPIFNFVLCRLGVVTPEQLISIRKYVVLAAFVIAAFLTPPDVLSQTLMALPMLALYEIGIMVAKWTACTRNQAAGALENNKGGPPDFESVILRTWKISWYDREENHICRATGELP